ncbi:mis12 domain-containing protein [Lasallia pustulata]|uniref:Mis12 domain-containing protein n=1 Tax=Lasallia pustulata TaxID=136370 RepID=A0A1W5D6P7_9LECA|nr:mis12 domain-containing protein [Lasallia pustulata]
MAASSRPADALLTEHFRYTPLSLIDDIINAVNTIIYRAIDAIESGLLSTPPAALGFAAAAASDSTIRDTDGDGNIEYPEARQEIEEGVHQLETLLEATVDKTFDRFEIYTLRNILTVPEDLEPWIRLSHYEVCLDPAHQRCSIKHRIPTTPGIAFPAGTPRN